jgi:CxxC-x17-CxxC domain-containing protein
MNNYKNKSGFNKSGPPRGTFGPRKFGAFSDRPRELFKAECSQCHNPCEVPFKPNGKKPVYCGNCFVKDESNGPRREFAPRPAFKREAPVASDRGLDDVKRELKSMNEKLDRLISVMERTVATPVVERESAKKPVKRVVSKKKAS